MALVLLLAAAAAAEARSFHKRGKLHAKLFRDDWTGPQNLPPTFNSLDDDDEWKLWKDDNINLGEKKVKDMMNEVKDGEKKEDIPLFEDPCKNVFCHYGRVCEARPEGKGWCVCAADDFCVNHNKRVCGTDGEWYPSHCELHRMACIKGIHIGINHSAKGCNMLQLKELHSKEAITDKIEVKIKKETLKEKSEKSEKVEEVTEEASVEKIKAPVEEVSKKYEPPVPPCTELEFERLKGNLLMYHCARIGDNCNDEPARKQFLANIMFSYYDHDNNGQLNEDELFDIEHRDHLEKLSRYCSLADMLTFDDKEDEDRNISLAEFYKAFNIPSVVLEDGLTTFTTTVTIGNSIELKCDIKGSTEIIWKRNGGLLDDITTEDVKVFEDGSLYISNLGLHHMGNYTCQDKFIDNIIQTHILRVQMPPIVKVSPSTQFHTTGSSVTLRCHADGVPVPDMLWEMNEAPLQEEGQPGEHYLMLHNNATLEIKTATYTRDTGAYKCKARNSAGVSQDIATVFIENSKLPQYSEGEEMKEAFIVFHDKGYTMYEPNHCHIEHQITSSFTSFKHLPEFSEVTLTLCEDSVPCSWGSAVNVENKYVYISQPQLNRVVVIDLTDRANPVEVIPTDKVPVSVEYVDHLDQVWVTCWNQEKDSGAKTIVVIRQASEEMQHHTVHTQPIGNRFDLVNSVYLPPNNDLKHHFSYGYVTHTDQRALYKLDLQAMKYAKTIDLSDFDCLPQSVAFIPLGGQIMVHCLSSLSSPQRSSRLILDYVTDKVIEYTDLGGEPHVSPDGRFMVVINKADNTLAVYRIHDDGKLEHLFDEYTNIHVSDVAFFPSERGRSYDFYASSVDKNDVLYINLASGKVEMIEGVGQAMKPDEWKWSGHNRVIVSGGMFGEFLMTPSKDAVVVIDGKRRHVQCEWQDIAHGNVIVWVQPLPL